MSKAQIASSYIEACKEKYLTRLPFETWGKAALVVGDNQKDNIGHAISQRLENSGYQIFRNNHVDFAMDTAAETLYTDGEYPSEMLDALICCAGDTHLDWIENQERSHIAGVIDSCLQVPIFMARNFVNLTLDSSKRKYIVFIGSMAYRNVLNGSAVYCAAKAGLAHFAKCIAWELAPKGYNVFCVHPSNTEGTPMTEQTIQGLMRYRNLSREQAEAYWGAVLPKERWLQPEDIAETVAWLVSGKADYLSGTNIDMAGGQR